jgi:ABC-2 type transport system permease protein
MMGAFRVFLGKELKEAWRSWRLPVILLVFLLLGISAPLIFKFIPVLVPPELKGTLEQLMKPSFEEIAGSLAKNLSQLGMLVLILFNMGSISEEKGRGQLELLFSRPVSRSSLVLAKFCASSLSAIGGLFLAFFAFYFYYALLFPPAPDSFRLVLGFALFGLFALLVISFTLFASSLFSSGPWAGLLSGAFFLVLSFLPSLGKDFARFSPSGMLGAANILMRGQAADFLDGLIVTAVAVILFLVLAMLVLERAEL